MTEHLVVLPHREVAREIAEELREEGFTIVEVVRMALAGEDDAEDVEWGVHIVEANIDDDDGAVEHGLRDRFEALAAEHDGWYDPEPDR